MKKREENVNIVKEQYKQIQKIYITRVKELEDNLIELNEKNQQIKKPNLENKDFKLEINKLKRKIRMLEDSVMRTVTNERGFFNKSNSTNNYNYDEDKFINKFQRFTVEKFFFY